MGRYGQGAPTTSWLSFASTGGALAGLVTGALTVIVWIAMGWNSSFLGGPGVYEMIPGFFLAMLAIVVVSLATDAKGEFRAIGSA